MDYVILTNNSEEKVYNNPMFSLKPGMSVIVEANEGKRVLADYSPMISQETEDTAEFLFENGHLVNKPFELEKACVEEAVVKTGILSHVIDMEADVDPSALKGPTWPPEEKPIEVDTVETKKPKYPGPTVDPRVEEMKKPGKKEKVSMAQKVKNAVSRKKKEDK